MNKKELMKVKPGDKLRILPNVGTWGPQFRPGQIVKVLDVNMHCAYQGRPLPGIRVVGEWYDNNGFVKSDELEQTVAYTEMEVVK